jgi:hypothetical protein
MICTNPVIERSYNQTQQHQDGELQPRDGDALPTDKPKSPPNTVRARRGAGKMTFGVTGNQNWRKSGDDSSGCRPDTTRLYMCAPH